MTASPIYSWSPIPGGTIRQWGPSLGSVMFGGYLVCSKLLDIAQRAASR